jgi:hypothetical protein
MLSFLACLLCYCYTLSHTLTLHARRQAEAFFGNAAFTNLTIHRKQKVDPDGDAMKECVPLSCDLLPLYLCLLLQKSHFILAALL